MKETELMELAEGLAAEARRVKEDGISFEIGEEWAREDWMPSQASRVYVETLLGSSYGPDLNQVIAEEAGLASPPVWDLSQELVDLVSEHLPWGLVIYIEENQLKVILAE